MNERKNLPQIIEDNTDLLNMDNVGNENYLVKLENGNIADISEARDVKMYRARRVRGDTEEEYIHFRDNRVKRIKISHEKGYITGFFKKIF